MLDAVTKVRDAGILYVAAAGNGEQNLLPAPCQGLLQLRRTGVAPANSMFVVWAGNDAHWHCRRGQGQGQCGAAASALEGLLRLTRPGRWRHPLAPRGTETLFVYVCWQYLEFPCLQRMPTTISHPCTQPTWASITV